eukprot:Nk52_evm45s554 gene=Nk52_evmTU45s554
MSLRILSQKFGIRALACTQQQRAGVCVPLFRRFFASNAVAEDVDRQVALRGMNFKSKVEDLTGVLGVKPEIVKKLYIKGSVDKQHPWGLWLVQLESAEDKKAVLEKKMDALDERTFIIDDMANVIKRPSVVTNLLLTDEEAAGRRQRSIRVMGLDYDVTKEQIKEFFDGKAKEIATMESETREHNGIATIIFDSVEDAQAALLKDKQYIGARYVDIVPGTQIKNKKTPRKSRPQRYVM